MMRILRRGPAPDFRHACIDDHVWAEIKRLKRNPTIQNAVVIGTLAVNFYAKPRYTSEIDILIPDDKQIEALQGTHVDVELQILTPDSINLSDAIAANVFGTATTQDGILVASREGLIALKLFGATQSARRYYQEAADVVSLLVDHEVDLTGWDLERAHFTVLEECGAMARGH
jgi:hypothetical protein